MRDFTEYIMKKFIVRDGGPEGFLYHLEVIKIDEQPMGIESIDGYQRHYLFADIQLTDVQSHFLFEQTLRKIKNGEHISVNDGKLVHEIHDGDIIL